MRPHRCSLHCVLVNREMDEPSKNGCMDCPSAAQEFASVFEQRPTVVAWAPGRMNLIGEHVDYNGGRVLPFAIDRKTFIAASPNGSGRIEAYSTSQQQKVIFSTDVAQPSDSLSWENYLRGMVCGLRALGAEIPGGQFWIGGNLPPGGGISSSAALCVAMGMALAKLANVDLPLAEIARKAQEAEHLFMGMPCGIMDQYAVSFSRQGYALLLDCRTLTCQHVPCEPHGLTMLVIPSGVKHALADGAYEQRVQSCRQALQVLHDAGVAGTSLADIPIPLLEEHRHRLDPLCYRRARHVITETQRVNHAVTALRAGNWRQLGELLWATQESLRDDYEVSCAEIDQLIDILHTNKGVLGGRMIGGGFGGVVLALIKDDSLETVQQSLLEKYYSPRNIPERPFVVRPSEGAQATLLD